MKHAFLPAFLIASSALVFAPSLVHADERSSKLECVDAHERALALRSSGKLRAARAALVTCGGDACPSVVRDECGRALLDLDASLPSVVLTARDAEGREVVDGRMRVRVDADVSDDAPLDGLSRSVDPGVRRFAVVRDGFVVASETVLVRQGEKNRAVTIALSRTDVAFSRPDASGSAPASIMRPLPFVLAGIGVAGLGTAGILSLHIDHRADDLAASCAPACSVVERDSLSTELVVANVVFGTGVVALAAAAATWLFAPRAPEVSR
jgi:hypothetical protein